MPDKAPFVCDQLMTDTCTYCAANILHAAGENPIVFSFPSLKVKGGACVLGKAVTSSTGDGCR